MILSNTRILDALDAKRLVIDPEPRPRMPSERPGQNCPYNTSSVDLRLGDEVSWFKEDLPLSIDLRQGKFATLFGPNSDRRKITDDQPCVLRCQGQMRPGGLVQA